MGAGGAELAAAVLALIGFIIASFSWALIGNLAPRNNWAKAGVAFGILNMLPAFLMLWTTVIAGG